MEKELQYRDEIVSLLDYNCFVEAGAGAGKTTILVGRILNQIKTGKALVNEIVAITFTNKAAEELKERIADRIRKEYKMAKENSPEKLRLKDALLNYDRMQISTIHSFCYRLLVEQTFLAKLRLDMEMLEADEDDAQAFAFFMNWYRKQPYSAVLYLKDNVDCYQMIELLKRTFLQICNLPDDTEVQYDKELVKRTLNDIKAEAAAIRAKFEAAIVSVFNDFQDFRGSKTHFSTVEEMINAGLFYKTFCDKYVYDDIAFLRTAYSDSFQMFKSNSSFGIGKEDAGSLTGDVYKAMGDFNGEAFFYMFMAHQMGTVLQFIIPARTEFRKIHPNRYISNDVLLQRARELVVENEKARNFFAKRYKCIYVDEFQDTDHIQLDLIWSICADEKGMLRDGALFVVGDPKQSIYKFRGADLPIFFETKKRMSALNNCKIYNLNYNFRTNIEAISWINQNSAFFIPDYVAMDSKIAHKKEKEGKRYLKGIYCFDSPGVSVRGFTPAVEADRFARIIRGLVDSDILIWDKDKNLHRKIEYRDFLLLCYSQYDMETYMKEFINFNIPVQISGKIDLNELSEIRRFIHIYNYLANPMDKRAREGALESVIREVISEKNEELAKTRLSALQEMTKDMSGDELLYFMSRHLEYVLNWDVDIDGNQLLRLEGQIQQMAENILSTRSNNRQDIYLGLNEYVSQSVDRELALFENSNAIRFMNLHKAKGLEGRIVCVLKRKEKLGKRLTPFQERREDGNYDYYPAVEKPANGFAKPTYIAYGSIDEVFAKAEMSEYAEGRRLEYVEITRCMEALIVSDSMSVGGDSFLKKHDFSEAKHMFKEFPELENYAMPRDDSPAYEYDTSMWEYHPKENAILKQSFSLTPSSLERAPKESQQAQASAARPVGRIYGTLIHRALELYVNAMRETNKQLEESVYVDQALMENVDLLEEEYEDKAKEMMKKYKEFLLGAVKKVSKDGSFIQEIKDAKDVYTEYDFKIAINRKANKEIFKAIESKVNIEKKPDLLPEKENLYISGKADLILIKDDGEIKVYDYKSDFFDGVSLEDINENLNYMYSGQMELYRNVIAKLFETKTDKVAGAFYSVN